MVWQARVLGLWFTVALLCFMIVTQVLIVVRFLETFDLKNPMYYILAPVPIVAFYYLVLFVITYSRLAVRLEFVNGELHARGLFGQRWRIPLDDIEAFRDADIYRRGRKQPVLQVGVIAGGMRSFVEALQKHAPNMKTVETADLVKQGRW